MSRLNWAQEKMGWGASPVAMTSRGFVDRDGMSRVSSFPLGAIGKRKTKKTSDHEPIMHIKRKTSTERQCYQPPLAMGLNWAKRGERKWIQKQNVQSGLVCGWKQPARARRDQKTADGTKPSQVQQAAYGRRRSLCRAVALLQVCVGGDVLGNSRLVETEQRLVGSLVSQETGSDGPVRAAREMLTCQFGPGGWMPQCRGAVAPRSAALWSVGVCSEPEKGRT